MIYNSINQLEKQIDTIIKGKKDAIKMSIVALLARGNLLIQDVPKVGKTTLAYALAKATDCSFQRIQFASDLMPSDIIGQHFQSGHAGIRVQARAAFCEYSSCRRDKQNQPENPVGAA